MRMQIGDGKICFMQWHSTFLIHFYKKTLSLGTAVEPIAPLQKNKSAIAMHTKSNVHASVSASFSFGCIFCTQTASFHEGSMYQKIQKLAWYFFVSRLDEKLFFLDNESVPNVNIKGKL